MGIEERFQQLSNEIKRKHDAIRAQQQLLLLKQGFERLKQMGSAYQILLLLPKSTPSWTSF